MENCLSSFNANMEIQALKLRIKEAMEHKNSRFGLILLKHQMCPKPLDDQVQDDGSGFHIEIRFKLPWICLC